LEGSGNFGSSLFFISTDGSTGVRTTAALDTTEWYESSRQTVLKKVVNVKIIYRLFSLIPFSFPFSVK
jgi:hypothetical protein